MRKNVEEIIEEGLELMADQTKLTLTEIDQRSLTLSLSAGRLAQELNTLEQAISKARTFKDTAQVLALDKLPIDMKVGEKKLRSEIDPEYIKWREEEERLKAKIREVIFIKEQFNNAHLHYRQKLQRNG